MGTANFEVPISDVEGLTNLGRERLSPNFFMREMLYSEVSNIHGVPNVPEDPQLALAAGRRLCAEILEPLRDRFGQIAIRSAYRSPLLNGFCSERYVAGDKACWCTDNESNAAHHIWDRRDASGFMGATATIVIPSYLAHYEATGDYRPLAWWMADHLSGYADIFFFRRLCAFNVRWSEGRSDRAIWFLDPPVRELLTPEGEPNFGGDHSEFYSGII